MGNHQSIHHTHKSRQWKQSTSKKPHIIGNPLIVEDILTKDNAYCYEVSLRQHHHTILKYINFTHPHVRQLIDIHIKQKTLLQCRNENIFLIFTQIIPCTFIDINLSQLENLVILKEVIEGAQALVGQYHLYFKITPKMIGFSRKGQTKIWLNQNYGKFQVQIDGLLRSQEEMVRSILDIFINKILYNGDIYQTITFQKLKLILQRILKKSNEQVMRYQIRQKIKKNQNNNNSSRKISINNVSISKNRLKSNLRRTSLDINIRNNTFHFKQNCIELRPQLNQSNRLTSQKGKSLYYSLKNSTNTIQNQSKIHYNYIRSPFISLNSYQTQQTFENYQKPFIRINYKNQTPIIQPNEQSKDQSFTIFPKQNFQPSTIPSKSNKLSILHIRNPNKKISSIIQRSQEDEATQNKENQYLMHQNSINQKILTFSI